MKNNKFLRKFIRAFLCLFFLLAYSQLYAQCPAGFRSTRVGYTTFASASGITGNTPYCQDDIKYEGSAIETFATSAPCQNASLAAGLGNGNYTIVGNVGSVNFINAGTWPLSSPETDGTFIFNPTNTNEFATYTIGGLTAGQTYHVRLQVRVPNALYTGYNCNNQGTRPRITISRKNGDSGGGGGISNASARTTVQGACNKNAKGDNNWDANNGDFFDMHPGMVMVFESDYTVGGGGGTQWPTDDGLQIHFAFQGYPATTFAIDYIEVIGCVKMEILSSSGADICSGTPTTLTAKGIGTPSDTYVWKTGASWAAGTVIGGATGYLIDVKPTANTTYWAQSTSNPGDVVSITIRPQECCGAGATLFTIPKICQPVTIDGNPNEAFWQMAPVQYVNNTSATYANLVDGDGCHDCRACGNAACDGVKGTNPLAQWQTVYDDQYIYFYVRVNNNNPQNPGTDDWWRTDAVEIYLQNNGGGTDQYVVRWNRGNGANQQNKMGPGGTYWEGEIRIPIANYTNSITQGYFKLEVGINQVKPGCACRAAQIFTWKADGYYGTTNNQNLHTAPLSPCVSAEASPITVCNGNTTTLSTQMKVNGSSTGYTWYQAATQAAAATTTTPIANVVPPATGTSNPTEVQPASSLWYVAVQNGVRTCPVQVTVINAPTINNTTPGSRCGTGTVNLSATTSNGSQVNWYTAQAPGGTLAGTTNSGATFTTPSISTNTTYYVEPAGSSCPGAARIPVLATINPASAGGTATSNQTICNNTQPAALSLTGQVGNIQWQRTTTAGGSGGWGNIGGATTATLSSATMGNLTATTYYRAVVNNGTGCDDAYSNTITITVLPVPTFGTITNQTICSGTAFANVNLSGGANPATGFTWTATLQSGSVAGFTTTANNAVTGTTLSGETLTNTGTTNGVVRYALTPRVANGGNFCTGNPVNFDVTVTARPAAPTVTTPVTYCQNAPASALTATGTGLLWYTTATGGTGSATAPTPSTTTAGSASYWVSQTVATCEGARAEIVVQITGLPNAPAVTSPVTYCQNATAVPLTATGTGLLWYTAATGGTGSATAPTPPTTTATAPTGTTWYVSQTVNNCEGPREPLTVIVRSNPTISVSTAPACSADLLTWSVSVTVSGGSVTSTAGTVANTPIGSNTWTISSITKDLDITLTVSEGTSPTCTTDLPVEAPDCDCDPMDAPAGEDEIYCNGETLTISASVEGEIFVIDWYDVPSSGTAVLQGSNTFDAPSAGTYYAQARNTENGCVSPRTAIEVTELPPFTSGAIAVTGQTICEGETINEIGSTTAAGGGDGAITYQWLMNDGTTTQPISTSSATYTPTVTAPGTYTFTRQAKDRTCNTDFESSAGSWVLTIIPQPAIRITTGTSPACSSDLTSWSVSVTVSGGNVTSTYGTPAHQGGNIWTLSGITKDLDITLTVTEGTAPKTCTATLPVDAPDCDCDPMDAPAGEDEIYCNGETLTISASVEGDDLVIDWYDVPSSGTAVLQGSNTFDAPSAGTYYAQARNTENGCVSPRTAIEVTELPLFTAGAIAADGQDICEDEEIIEIGSITPAGGGDGTITYQWLMNDGVNPAQPISTNNTVYTPTVTAPGTYTFTRQAKDGTCNTDFESSAGSWVLTINPNPNIFGAAAISKGGTVNLTVTDGNNDALTGGTWSVDPPADGAAINSSGVFTLALGSSLTAGTEITVVYTRNGCTDTHTITLSSVGSVEPHGIINFCPGDELHPIPATADANVTGWAFYLSGTTPPTSANSQPDFDLGAPLADSHDGQVWMVLPFNNTEPGIATEFVRFIRNQDLDFELSYTTPVCVGSQADITAVTLSSSPTPANVQYNWGEGYGSATSQGQVTGIAGLTNSISVDGKADNYCVATKTGNYAVVELDVVKNNWATLMCVGANGTLSLTNNSSSLPAGASLQIKWYATPASTGVESHIASNDNQLSLAISNIQETTSYRVEVDIIVVVNSNDVVICTQSDLTGTIDVPVFEINLTSNSANIVSDVHQYCAGDAVTLTGSATGLSTTQIAMTWQWYKGAALLAGEEAITLTIAEYAAADAGTYRLVGTFEGCNEDETIQIGTNPNFDFTLNYTSPLCLNTTGTDATVTAVVSSLLTPAPTNIQYDWGNGSGIANTNVLDTSDAGINLSISVDGRASGYCVVTRTGTYSVVGLDVVKDSWATTMCIGDNGSLALTNNSSPLPSGASLRVRWYAKAGTNAEVLAATNSNASSLSIVNIQETTSYRVEIEIIDGSSNVICRQPDLTGTITVPVFTMGIISNSSSGNDGYCVGETMTLTGTGTGGTSFQWYKDGNPLANATSTTYSKEFADGDQGVYTFEAINSGCSDDIAITISKNADLNFTVPTTPITVCNDAAAIPLQASNVPSDAVNPAFVWSSDNGGSNTGATFNFPRPAAGTGNITVTGKANNYCETTKTIPYTIVDINPYYSLNPSNFCANSTVPIDLRIDVTGVIPAGITYDVLWEKQDGGSWSGVGNNATLSVSPPATTVYRASITIKDASNNAMCTRSTNPHTVNVLDLGMGATGAFTICETDRISLEGTTATGVEGAWLDAGKNMIQSWQPLPAGRYLQNQYPPASTEYYFVARTAGGICQDTQRFDVRVKKRIKFTLVPPAVNICVGASEMITTNVTEPAGETMNYKWYVDGVLKGAGPEFEFIGQVPKTGGVIEIHAPTTDTHCESTMEVPYTTSQVKITSANWQKTFCPGEPVTLDAAFEEQPIPTLLTYRWYENGAPIEPAGTGTYAIRTFNPTASAIYKLEVTNEAGCQDTKQESILMIDMNMQISADTAICPGDELPIFAIPANAQTNFTIHWMKQGESDPEPLPMIQTGMFFRDRPTERTVYTAFYTNTTCTGMSSIEVDMLPVPVIVAIEEIDPRRVEFIVESGWQPYYFAVNQQTYFTLNPISDRLPIGHNIVFVKDVNGCRTSMPFAIGEPPLVFPPFFTPDGIQDENRKWWVRGLELFDDIELIIYDRFGKQLIRWTNSENAAWDGIYLGKLMPSTDYWYLLTVRETGRQYTGHFTLIR